jgi:hypothetical protein
MKRPSSKARGKSKHPFENKKVDFAKFKSHPPVTEIAKLTLPGVGTTMPYGVPIETLSARKTVGLGYTWLNLGTPWGVFPHHNPPLVSCFESGYVEAHFDPIAYGITSVATYIMAFNIQTAGPATFWLDGYVGSGSLPNKGSKTVNGSVTVALLMKDVQPYQQTYGYLRHTAGASWSWYSTVIKFPDIVVTLP